MSESPSVFGELYFQLTDTIKFTVGLRYNDDKKDDVRHQRAVQCAERVQHVGPCLGAAATLLQGCPRTVRHPVAALDAVVVLHDGADRRRGAADGGCAGACELLRRGYEVQCRIGRGWSARPVQAINTLNGVPPVPGFNEQRVLTGSPSTADWQETTGRGVVDWQYSDSGMTYASYSRGYKPGGFNPPLNASFVASTTAKYTFEPEKVDAFEIGSKPAFMDGALTVNSAVFYYDYQGLQTTRIANNTSINDNMDAEIYGFELETYYYPEQVEGLAVDFSYSYLHAQVDGSTSVDPLERTGGDPAFITFKNIDAGSNTGVNFVANRTQITQAIVNSAYAACRAIGAANNAPGGLCTPPGAPAPVPIVVANAQTMYPTVNGVALPAYMSKSFLQSQGVDGVRRVRYGPRRQRPAELAGEQDPHRCGVYDQHVVCHDHAAGRLRVAG